MVCIKPLGALQIWWLKCMAALRTWTGTWMIRLGFLGILSSIYDGFMMDLWPTIPWDF